MAITSIGSDLCQISRIEELLESSAESFCDKIFTRGEREYCDSNSRGRASHYAGRYAVKEAVMKALGTGWGEGVRWQDIETTRTPAGAPELLLPGETAALARERGITRWHVTITHDAGLALAFVVAESSS
jgi:holo-[acyl-carrier protein] synthase